MPNAKQPSTKVSQHAVLLSLIDDLQEQFEQEYVNELLEELLIYALTHESYAKDHEGTGMMYDHFTLVFKLRKVMASLMKLSLYDLDQVLAKIPNK